MPSSLKLKIARILAAQADESRSCDEETLSGETLPSRREAAMRLVCAVAAIPSVRRWLEELETYSLPLLHHSVAVAGLVAEFSLGMGGVDQGILISAALLHDVGKLRTPLAILNKPGKLTPEEMQEMQLHTVHGYDLLKGSDTYPHEVLDAVRHHHETLDGSGYPDGLSGEEVSWTVRWIAVFDVYTALTADRVYRKALPPAEALAIMKTMALDHDVLAMFSKFIMRTTSMPQPV